MPTLNIIESGARNAFASGIDDRSYSVTVTRGLVDSLSKNGKLKPCSRMNSHT